MKSLTQLTANELTLNITTGISVAAICVIIGIILWRKLRENESLKYEFITIIAHKFRTPLTGVKWAIEGLISNEQDPYKKQVFQEISASNEHLIKLTNTLVELTDSAGDARSSYNLERVNLCDFARIALENAKKTFHEKNLFLSITCSVPEIFVSVDRNRMEFVLGTLLENACNYTPPGRNVVVDVSADQRRAAVAVTDAGIGIEPHEMQHLFTKFYRTKAAQAMDTEGFGVGLYLARKVSQRHGGKLEAFSDGPDRGSTVRLILPRVA